MNLFHITRYGRPVCDCPDLLHRVPGLSPVCGHDTRASTTAECDRLNDAAPGGYLGVRGRCPIDAGYDDRIKDAAPELLDLARRVAEHFADTDAPLGVSARAVIAKATAQEAAQ